MPLVLSVSLSLPSLLLHLPHPMSAIPGGDICLTSDSDILQQQHTFQSSVAILGFCLPLAIIICLVIGLSVRLDIIIHIILLLVRISHFRRCVSCYSATCVSSFCKEELLLSLLTIPVMLANLLVYLPVLDTNLTQLSLPVTGLAELVSPTLARMIEMLTSGALPLLVFILLPAYSNWSSQPDNDDIRSGYRYNYF